MSSALCSANTLRRKSRIIDGNRSGFGFLRRRERDQPGECAGADGRWDDRDGGIGNAPKAATIIAAIRAENFICRKHGIDPRRDLTQLLTNPPATPISQLDQWLPDQWKQKQNVPVL